MKVANIVSDSKVDVSKDFNIVKTTDEIIDKIPTLIVGWDFIKEKYPDYDILNKKLSDNVYWTFKKTEKRDIYEEDIFNFIELSYKSFVNKTTYIFIDPIHRSRKEIKKILKKIYSFKKIISYEHGHMIYIYGENLIFGVDLNLIEFIGLNINKIKTKIIQISNIFLTEKDIFIEYKKRVEILDNQVKYIPLLYSIENG